MYIQLILLCVFSFAMNNPHSAPLIYTSLILRPSHRSKHHVIPTISLFDFHNFLHYFSSSSSFFSVLFVPSVHRWAWLAISTASSAQPKIKEFGTSPLRSVLLGSQSPMGIAVRCAERHRVSFETSRWEFWVLELIINDERFCFHQYRSQIVSQFIPSLDPSFFCLSIKPSIGTS